MPRYATLLAGDPAATYRQMDLVGRTTTSDPFALTTMLYEEGIAALRTAAWAAENDKFEVKSERVTRATAVLFALEAGLDFVAGGEVSHTLARVYGGARRTIIEASMGQDPAPFRDVASDLEEIAQAWRTIRAA